jgi:hypothetical protein
MFLAAVVYLIYHLAAPSFDIMATPTISLQPYSTNRDGPEFSGRRRTVTLVVGAIAAVVLLLLLFLGECLLRRDRRRRLLAKAEHELPQPLDVNSEGRAMSSTARQAWGVSERTADQIVGAPGTSSISSESSRCFHDLWNMNFETTVPGSAAARQYPEVYNYHTQSNIQALI